MNKRLDILDKCSAMLSDWLCDRPDTVGSEGIYERVELALDLLQSLKSYTLAGSPPVGETHDQKLNRLFKDNPEVLEILKQVRLLEKEHNNEKE